MAMQKIITPEYTFSKDLELQKQELLAKQAAERLRELAEIKDRELQEKMETLEILPIGQNLIILPYPTNPYVQQLSKGGLILNGYTGQFLNPDSGENDKLNLGIGCAKVIEVGPACKYVKNGDDIFYDTRVIKPVPFMNCGYYLTNEPNITAVINEGLTTRFKNVQ